MTKKKNIINANSSKPLLELVMIVKNAEGVIEETLKAVKPYIDSYTILDTGSRDNTVQIIKRAMEGCKGEVYQEPFIDFSTSRNRVLDLAGEKCKYTLMLDDTYVLNNGEDLRKILKKENKEAFDIRILDAQNKNMYYSTRILATKSRIRYKYRIHEIPDVKHLSFQILNDTYLFDNNSTTIGRSHLRYRSDIKNLLLDLEDYPDNLRILYHLAGTYSILLENKEAKKTYEKIIKICKDRREENEILYNAYYNLAILLYNDENKTKDNWKLAEHNFILASKIMKMRAEPLYHIAAYYYNEGDLEKAYTILEKASKLPLPMNMDLQVYTEIYGIKIPYLFLETSLILKKVELNDALIKRVDSLIQEYPQISHFYNIKEMLTPSQPSKILRYNNAKVVVFHTSFNFGNWDPVDITSNKKVSGSEIMTRNLGIALQKIGYKVVIFGNFEKDIVYEGVEFIDNKKYLEWIKTRYIDYLIVSREPNRIYYLPNIQNVYLWVHDVLPTFEFVQAHRTKFKSVLSLCSWHLKYVTQHYNVPEENIKITRNAINSDLFKEETEKISNRFIYSSYPNRGLINLLEMWPKIILRYPDATLELFCNTDLITEYEMGVIQKYPSIHIHSRVTQEQLSQEFLKSDIWFYPTDWLETYCITAVEAQAAGCVCVTTKKGSLPEIVGRRGIVADVDITKERGREEILQELFNLMDNKEEKDRLSRKGREWALRQTYESLAKEWSENFLI